MQTLFEQLGSLFMYEPGPRFRLFELEEKVVIAKNVTADSLPGRERTKARYFIGLWTKGGISAVTLYIGTEKWPRTRDDNTRPWLELYCPRRTRSPAETRSLSKHTETSAGLISCKQQNTGSR